MSRWQRPLLAGLLLLLFARLSLGASELSFTSDEPSHIASGYAYWARHADWTIPLRGHPLLINAWSALPVYLGQPHIPLETLDGWGEDNTRYVHSFTPYLTAHVTRAEVAARTPVMLLSVLLAATVIRWAADLWGTSGSFLAGLILLCDPTLLAHGMLATNDVGVTALGTMGLFAAWRVLRRPTAARVGLTGLLLGMALLAKSSGVLWLGAAWLIFVEHAWRDKTFLTWGKRALVFSGLALLTVWAFYGFAWGRLPGVPVPLPAPTHWQALFLQSDSAAHRWTYLLGRIGVGKRWDYFPVAFLVKNPLPLLALLAGSLVAGVRRKFPRWLWGLPLLYAAVAMLVGVNIGYRHLLPIHPFLYLMIGSLATYPLNRALRWGLGVCLAWLSVESLWVAPNYIGYFNQLTLGSRNGWRVLADSNTDWGQGYKQLRDFQVQHQLNFRYAGPRMYVKPEDYGVHYEPLPPAPENPAPLWPPYLAPPPGDYVISAVILSGQQIVYPDDYAWFRYQRPTAIIAQSLFYYHVPPTSGSDWLAQCDRPSAPLSEPQVRLGETLNRQLSFDCTQTWLYPLDEGGQGWYLLHDKLFNPPSFAERVGNKPPTPRDPFVARHLRPYPLSFRQWDYRDTPAFALFRANRSAATWPQPRSVLIAPAGTPPRQIRRQAATPLDLDGPLTFLGVRTYKSETRLDVETWWLVSAFPITRPFSIMAHTVQADGVAVEVADGLGLSPQSLRQGDVLVQRHRFAHPEGDLWLRLGAYWLSDQHRWPVSAAPNCDAIFIKP